MTESEPVLAYMRSSENYDGQDLGSAQMTVEDAIAREGAFMIAKPLGVISAAKP